MELQDRPRLWEGALDSKENAAFRRAGRPGGRGETERSGAVCQARVSLRRTKASETRNTPRKMKLMPTITAR